MKLDSSKLIGVKRMPDWKPTMAFEASAGRPTTKWTQYAIVTDNQHNLPACAGFATANWIECMLRKTMGKSVLTNRQQIDGETIWRRARRMFWSQEPVESGGIYMDQGFKAAIDLGILPPDTGIHIEDMTIGKLCSALKTTPVLQGTDITASWSTPNSENGQIPLEKSDSLGGHATCIVGVLKQNNSYFVLFQNSWGSEWGYGGYGVITSKQWAESLLFSLVFAVLPKSFNKWTGWKRFVVTK